MDISDVLRSVGFEVIEASTADEAIRILESGVLVSIVFTDIRMPGKADGLDLARYVRACHTETQILVTSAHFPPGRLDPEFGPLINKPYTHERVIAEIEKRLAPKAQDRQEPSTA